MLQLKQIESAAHNRGPSDGRFQHRARLQIPCAAEGGSKNLTEWSKYNVTCRYGLWSAKCCVLSWTVMISNVLCVTLLRICDHIGKLSNCGEHHFGKGGKMWTNNSGGHMLKFYNRPPSAHQLTTADIFEQVCAFVQWLGRFCFHTERFTEYLIRYRFFVLFFFLGKCLILLSTQGWSRFLPKKSEYEMLRITFFCSVWTAL